VVVVEKSERRLKLILVKEEKFLSDTNYIKLKEMQIK
jgi:hypothetical protein